MNTMFSLIPINIFQQMLMIYLCLNSVMRSTQHLLASRKHWDFLGVLHTHLVTACSTNVMHFTNEGCKFLLVHVSFFVRREEEKEASVNLMYMKYNKIDM